ncbi:SiaB family protein kinase [bacterium SCSIO 12741]|nr:SiaB family protein kinase [bacterium SCSIO 12741]
MIDLKEIADKLSENDIVLTYHGRLDKQVINDLLHFTESVLITRNVERRIRKKVFSILVESLQNSYKNALLLEESKDQVTALLLRNQGVYELNLGNYLSEENKDKLIRQIEDINALDSKQLVEKYQSVLKDGKRTALGGSGLGLLDMARKSGNQLSYKVTPGEDGLYYFLLKIIID